MASDVIPAGCIAAAPAVDMWGLGATLLHMLRGSTLVHADGRDNAVSPRDEAHIAGWSDSERHSAIASVADSTARHLLSLLLAPDPAVRPSAERVLQHPFVTGRAAVRLPADAAAFDVFISYRVASEAALAGELYDKLRRAGLRVWWDKACLVDGHTWREGFCRGLANSRIFVALVSPAAIGSASDARCNWSTLRRVSACDNVLLEHRLAAELRARGLLEALFPVFVGAVDAEATANQRSSGTDQIPAPPGEGGPGGGGGELSDAGSPPRPSQVVRRDLFSSMRTGELPPPADVIVDAVEETLRQQLDQQGLGTPLLEPRSAAGVWSDLLAYQGCMFSGPHDSAMGDLVRRVVALVSGTSAVSGAV